MERNDLVLNYLPLANKIAYRMRGVFHKYPIDHEDLVNQAVIGLCRAVDIYQKGDHKFYLIARGYIYIELFKLLSSVGGPGAKFRRKQKLYHEIKRETFIRFRRDITFEEILTETGFSTYVLSKILEYEEEMLEFNEEIFKQDDTNILEKLSHSDLMQIIDNMICSLQEEQQKVLDGIYNRSLSCVQIGKELNKSAGWMSKQRQKAVAKLKAMVKELKDNELTRELKENELIETVK